jgi:hypothetical protein
MLNMMRYSLYVIFHPFKGFWDLKNENRGNVRSASAILALVVLTFILRYQLTGFLVNDHDPDQMNIYKQIAIVLIPFFLWCIANWSVTTLVDGKGSLKDIYITTSYALTPFVALSIPLIAVSNLITLNEMELYVLIDIVTIVWSGILLFTGIMTIHHFSFLKMMITLFVVILGMIIIVFLLSLFFTLVQQFFNFLYIIYREIAIRL